jgi:hypothetical protein
MKADFNKKINKPKAMDTCSMDHSEKFKIFCKDDILLVKRKEIIL